MAGARASYSSGGAFDSDTCVSKRTAFDHPGSRVLHLTTNNLMLHCEHCFCRFILFFPCEGKNAFLQPLVLSTATAEFNSDVQPVPRMQNKRQQNCTFARACMLSGQVCTHFICLLFDKALQATSLGKPCDATGRCTMDHLFFQISDGFASLLPEHMERNIKRSVHLRD